jgi:glycosyltransferase involved in cell wall biosynthesis
MLAGKPGRIYLSDHNQLSISCVHELNIPKYFISAVMHLTYTWASGLVAVSEGVKKEMCSLGGFPESLVKVIYNPTAIGISPHRESILVSEELWGKGFDHHILSIGTLKAQKDHATLIKAFALLPYSLNVKLIILGDGSLRSELEGLVVQLGLQDRVSFPGFVVDIYPWMRSADLFVLSSRWEGFGNVIVEALECGVPVVSTNCASGPAEILENGCYGKLVPLNDPVAMAAAISASLAEPHEREALIKRAKYFSVEKIAEEYLDYFRECGANV